MMDELEITVIKKNMSGVFSDVVHGLKGNKLKSQTSHTGVGFFKRYT